MQEQLLTQLQEQAQTITTRGLGLLLGTFNWVLDLILIVVISFYMLMDGERLWNRVAGFFAPPIRDFLTESFRRQLQRFFSGQLLLGLFMAVTLSLIFWGLTVPFFLVFALFIGLSPAIVLASLLVGGRVGGLLSVILAIPLAGMIKTVVDVLVDPTLPPQTGSFFFNPFEVVEPEPPLQCEVKTDTTLFVTHSKGSFEDSC